MPYDQLTVYLKNIIGNAKHPQSARDLASKILDKWNNKITPSPKTLEKLAKEIIPPDPCSRIHHDGSCAWLRKYGAGYRLPVPPAGERAICCYPDNYTTCPGYKKARS